jgi:hypothetical protein
MTSTPDDNQFDLEHMPVGPWVLSQPQPAILVLAGVSDSVIESPTALAQRLADITGGGVDLHTDTAPPEDVAWLASIDLEDLPAPLLCWPEDAATEGTGLPDDIEARPGLVVQSLLHPADPLTCMANLLRLLTLLDPEGAGILDTDTGRWLDHEMLARHLINSSVEPQEDILWMVTATGGESGHDVVTTGLNRCGRRELAIADVAENDVDAAAELLATVAGLSLETPLPAVGGVIEIGPGLQIGIGGDIDDESAPVLLQSPGGQGPPVEVLRRLTDEVAAVYQTERATDRHRALAVETWDQFLSLHEPVLAAGGVCYVEVPWEQLEGDEPRREHLWMEVVSQQDGSVMAAPAHDAVLIEDVPAGPSLVDLAEICSWRVVLDNEPWGPEQLDLLRKRLELHS